MASPNRQHWPSMFRSKHASQLWQPQPDMSSSPPSLLSGGSLKSPFSSSGNEERSTDPKPRWNPRPEQIRILEAIFNSGMVNPPRDEIPRIRMQLQEYGQVGDANVFYWFQNRKSRSKNKLRAAAARAAAPAAPARACAPPVRQQQQQAAAPFTTPPPPAPRQVQVQPHQLLLSPSPVAPTSSSSSSSDRSSGSSRPVKPAAQAMSATAAVDLLSPLAAACHQQMHYQLGQPVVSAAPAPAPAPAAEEFVAAADEPIFPQWPQGHCLSVGELVAILGAQYVPVPVPAQQPPAAFPAGMLLGLCNVDVAAGPTSTGHRGSAWPGAGFGQYWPCAGDQLGLGKNCGAPALNTSVSREEAYKDATKLGLLQYGFGISTPAPENSATAAAVLRLPASPEPAVTVATVAATAGLASTFATTVSTGAVTYDHLQGPAPDNAAGFAGTGTVATAVARGAAVVCVAGTSATCSVPATRLDVKAYFGEGAVLVRCDGERAEPLLVDESGLTVESLQHGALYCVLI